LPMRVEGIALLDLRPKSSDLLVGFGLEFVPRALYGSVVRTHTVNRF
jgi:hypothetical protein